MLLATVAATAFVLGWLAGHFELAYRVALLLDTVREWALRRDGSHGRDLVWWVAVVPVMVLALFVAHPVRGTRIYLRTRRARRAAAPATR